MVDLVYKNELMFVNTMINSEPSKGVLVDSSAFHNFISNQEACKLRLKIVKKFGKVKVVNLEALPIVESYKKVKRNGSDCGSYVRLRHSTWNRLSS